MAKKKRLPRQKLILPKAMSDAEALRKLKAAPDKDLPKPPPMFKEPGEQATEGRPSAVRAAEGTEGEGAPGVAASSPRSEERDDGVQVIYDQGKTTGFEGMSQHQLLERIAVMLEALPGEISQHLAEVE